MSPEQTKRSRRGQENWPMRRQIYTAVLILTDLCGIWSGVKKWKKDGVLLVSYRPPPPPPPTQLSMIIWAHWHCLSLRDPSGLWADFYLWSLNSEWGKLRYSLAKGFLSVVMFFTCIYWEVDPISVHHIRLNTEHHPRRWMKSALP